MRKLSFVGVITALGMMTCWGNVGAVVVDFSSIQACSMQVPTLPPPRDIDTMLLAHLDAEDSNDADYARVDRRQIGNWADAAAQGRFGSGASAAPGEEWILLYPGHDNISAPRGSVEFWVRSLPDENIWADESDRQLFLAYANPWGYPGHVKRNITVHKSGADRNLHFKVDWPEATEDEFDLAVPVGELAADQWHHIAFSWDDTPPGHIWLLVDGVGQHAVLGREEAPKLGFVYLLKFGPGGAAIDEIRIQSQSIASRLDGSDAPGMDFDPDQLLHMQDIVRDWIDFLLKAQQYGFIPIRVNYHTATSLDQPSWRPNNWTARHLGLPFLWGYRIWGDERYLRAACEMGHFYARAQFPAGGWPSFFYLYPGGTVTQGGPTAHFEEWVQSNGVRYLAACYYLTGDEFYKEAAAKAGEAILRGQHESGWWPWGIPGHAADARADYLKGPTLNDWAINACMADCLVLYHMTGDDRFWDAILRAGEWFISAQLADPTPGWAAQYDMDGEPCWARRMEPPAADTNFGTYGAGEGLLMLYDMTGDERYLQPLRKHMAWLESIPEAEKGWFWYAHRDWSAEENKGRWADAETTEKYEAEAEYYGTTAPSQEARKGISIKAGEPIVACYYQMCPVDHPEVDSYLIPLKTSYGARSEHAEKWLAEELEERQNGPIVPAWDGPVAASQREAARLTPASCAAAYDPDAIAYVVGYFEDWQAGRPGFVQQTSDGSVVQVYQGCQHALTILRQIALAYAAQGKLPADIIPMYRALDYAGDFTFVDPARDWYDVPVPE